MALGKVWTVTAIRFDLVRMPSAVRVFGNNALRMTHPGRHAQHKARSVPCVILSLAYPDYQEHSKMKNAHAPA